MLHLLERTATWVPGRGATVASRALQMCDNPEVGNGVCFQHIQLSIM